MNLSGLPDPNSNIKLHAVLILLGLFNVYFGFPWYSIPIFAWVIARWLVMGIGFLKRDAEERALKAWHGRYYAFDGQQVRIHWDDDAIWVEARDIFKAIKRKPDSTSLRRIQQRLGAELTTPTQIGVPCFSPAGAIQYLAAMSDRDAIQCRLWLERDVFPNIRRSRQLSTDSHS